MHGESRCSTKLVYGTTPKLVYGTDAIVGLLQSELSFSQVCSRSLTAHRDRAEAAEREAEPTGEEKRRSTKRTQIDEREKLARMFRS